MGLIKEKPWLELIEQDKRETMVGIDKIPGTEPQVELDQGKQDPGLTIRFECSALQTPVTK